MIRLYTVAMWKFGLVATLAGLVIALALLSQILGVGANWLLYLAGAVLVWQAFARRAADKARSVVNDLPASDPRLRDGR
jgi:hypothetical protein